MIKIIQHENGYSVETEEESYVYHDLVSVLQHIVSDIEPGSRYDSDRIYVIQAPGDKHPDFTDELADLVFKDI